MEHIKDRPQDHANTIVSFIQYLHDKTYNADRNELGNAVIILLHDLLEKWSAGNNNSNRWKNVESKDFVNIIFIHAADEVMDTDLHIGMHKDGIYLEMEIACPEKLPYMPDAFWQQWLELNSFGDFELTQTDVFSEQDEHQYPVLRLPAKSNIYLLMRKVIAFPMIYQRPMDLGKLCITWPFDQYSITEVEEKGTLAFQRMCNLNNWLKVFNQKL